MTGSPSLDLRESVWRAVTRWGACAIAVLLAHGAIAAGLLSLPAAEDHGVPPPSPIMIDLTEAATPMASVEDVSKMLPDGEPPPPVPQTVRNPLLDAVPTPEVKIEITIDIPPPEPPPPVDLKPPEKVVRKPPPKPPQKIVKRAEPARAPPSPAPPAEKASGAPSPLPPAAVPQPNPRAVATWQGALFAHLARHKRYPTQARSRGDEGVVHLRFTMTRQGAVVAQRVEKTSGVPVLDIEAVDLVRRAQPLPPPPADMPGEQIEIVVPLRFNLH